MTKRALTIQEIGRKGGKARAAKMTPAERSAAARKAGLANADRIARLQAELAGFKANSAKQGGDG